MSSLKYNNAKIALLIIVTLLIFGCGKNNQNKNNITDQIDKDSISKAEEIIALRNAKKNAEKNRIPSENFDTTITALPEKFEPHDPLLVYDNLSLKIQNKKSEFESSGDFKKRMDAFKSVTLYDNTSLNKSFVFAPQKYGFNIKYNADKNEYTYRTTSECANHSCTYVRLLNAEYDSQMQIGEGISVESWNKHFKEKEFKTITHASPIFLETKTNKNNDIYCLYGRANVSVKYAKEQDSNLRVLIIGNIVPTYHSSAQNIPRESYQTIFEHIRVINFQPTGLWLVNTETKEIISKRWNVGTAYTCPT